MTESASYVINTQQGIVFDLKLGPDGLDDFLDQLNNPKLTAVSISDIGLHKRNFLSVPPKVAYSERGPGVFQLKTTDGIEYFVRLAEDDSVSKVVARINDRNQQFVKIGDADTAVIIQSQNFDFIIDTELLETT